MTPRFPANLHPVLSARLRFAILMATTALGIFLLLRFFLISDLVSPKSDRSMKDIFDALLVGGVRDLGVALLFMAPFTLLLQMRRDAWRGRFGRMMFFVLTGLALFLLLFSAIAEIFFWNEFDSRLNGIALYYLMFPREVIGNLQESFNIGLYLPLIGAMAAGLAFLYRQPLRRALNETPAPRSRLRETGASLAAALTGIILLTLISGDISENREVNQLGENGWSTIVSAALTNDQDYENVYPGMDELKATRITRQLVKQDNTTFLDSDGERSILRWVDNGNAPKKLNIVMVTNESFGSKFINALDNKHDTILTPALDKLSGESLSFTNIYASGDRTVRGLEATETGFTVIPGISTARRAESVGMYSLPALLKSFGYQANVLYGGRPSFDNMGAFWSGIGFEHVWGQSDVRHDSFTTAWGVSDEDLYTEALQRMDEMETQSKPFLLTLMTVSNHRPYKFPENHIKFDPTITNRANSARYADWAYGDFIERARKHKWFDNTIFVFVADHSEKINGAAQVPLQDMRIPVIIYSPKNIEPRIVDTLGAQIDLIPTLLGRMGFSYVSPFFGKDLLRVPENGGWFTTAHNFSVAYGKPGHVAVLNPHSASKGYAFEAGLKPLVPEKPEPQTLDEAIALTQTAHRMFYHHQYHVPADGWPKRHPHLMGAGQTENTDVRKPI